MPPVQVKDHAFDPAAAGGHRGLRRVGDQFRAHVVRQRPAHQTAREQVDHGRQIHPRTVDRQLRDVTDPPDIGPVRGEVASDQVRHEGRIPVLDGRAAAFAQVTNGWGPC